MSKLALGIDIGGTNSVFGLCDIEGNILYEESIPTRDFESPDLFAQRVYSRLNEMGYLSDVSGIGIGAPNGNYYTGNIEFAPNLNWKGSIPLAKIFKQQFNLPIIVTNDANAAAIGEMLYGAGKGLSDFVTITLGTGLGSGVIANGKLVYGHDGLAGEYGHIRFVHDGRQCGCGRKGCLETYVSATGVVRSITELNSANKASSQLLQIAKPKAEDVFNLAKANDLFAKEIIDFTEKILGEALADFACFSSPKAYILFGGIAQSGNEFAARVKKHMENAILNIYKNKIDIRISPLHDKNSAVLGSASLVWNETILKT